MQFFSLGIFPSNYIKTNKFNPFNKGSRGEALVVFKNWLIDLKNYKVFRRVEYTGRYCKYIMPLFGVI